jgi:excisionase family DNA binding protein
MGQAPTGRVGTETSLLTSFEVARLLRVHPKHVYRLLRGGLPGLRVGGEWRFEPERVLAWAQARAAARRGEPDRDPGDPPLVAANDDEAVAILLDAVGERGSPIGCVRADSGTGLDLIARGRVAVAGFHRREVPRWAGRRPLARIHLVRREVGLVGRPGRGRPRLSWCLERRMASRPPTSGSRSLLDQALAEAGLSPSAAAARSRCLSTHRDVVCSLLRGEADVGVTSRDWAERAGLPFRALGLEDYDLLVPSDRLGSSTALRLCEAAASPRVRRRVGSLPGHSTSGAGTVGGEGTADRGSVASDSLRGPAPGEARHP